jgi:hypothetical protein
MVVKNMASSAQGIGRSSMAGIAGCFERVARNVKTTARHGFKVDRAKGNVFRVGFLGTCEGIAKANCAASLNGTGYPLAVAETASSPSEVAGEACTAATGFKSALSSISILVSSSSAMVVAL